MPLNEDQTNVLKTKLDSTSTLVADSASQLLNSEASLSFDTTINSACNNDSIILAEDSVVLSAESSHGTLLVAFNLKTACALAAQMMGSEPADDLDDSQIEALVSLVSQSVAAAISQSEDLAGIELAGFTLIKTQAGSAAELATGGAEMLAVNLKLSLDSGLSSTIRVELPMAIVEAFTGASSGDTVEAGGVAGTNFAEIKDNTDLDEVDEEKNLNLLMDIRMGLIVELGRAEMHLKDILKLTKGSIIELDRLSGEPVDLFVNNKLIARGEVVVIDDNFGLRITQLAGTKSSRMEDMGLLTADR